MTVITLDSYFMIIEMLYLEANFIFYSVRIVSIPVEFKVPLMLKSGQIRIFCYCVIVLMSVAA